MAGQILHALYRYKDSSDLLRKSTETLARLVTVVEQRQRKILCRC